MKSLEVTVEAKVTVSEEMARRCMRILEMYLNDHPEEEICCENLLYPDGYRRELYLRERKEKRK